MIFADCGGFLLDVSDRWTSPYVPNTDYYNLQGKPTPPPKPLIRAIGFLWVLTGTTNDKGEPLYRVLRPERRAP